MKNFLNYSKKGGFTLIELLIVIAIIGLLTGIVVANLTQSRAKARDAKRISDMGQIQLALELYFDRCQKYPDPNDINNPDAGVDIESSCLKNGQTISLKNFISKIPVPSGEKGQDNYSYYVNADKSDYYLKAILEGYNEVLKDGLSDFELGGNLQLCDNSSPDGRDYCIGPK